MSYDEKIEKTGIKEHPLTAFQNMGNLSEGDDFATEFAELLDILSKNIVIPVELIDENANVFSDYEGETKEDVLKEWAAEHGKGERIYAEIDGSLQIIDVPEDASGPIDVGVRGVGGGLEELSEKGEVGDALVIGEDEITTQPVVIDQDIIVLDEGVNESIDVSDFVGTAQFTIVSAPGSDGSDASGFEDASGGLGAPGTRFEGQIIFEPYEELVVTTPQNESGYTDAISGGGGSAGIEDGSGNTLIEVGGGGQGGGGTVHSNTPSSTDEGSDGSDGGGEDGIGGSGGSAGSVSTWTANDGEDGEMGEVNIHTSNIEEIAVREGVEPECRLFD